METLAYMDPQAPLPAYNPLGKASSSNHPMDIAAAAPLWPATGRRQALLGLLGLLTGLVSCASPAGRGRLDDPSLRSDQERLRKQLHADLEQLSRRTYSEEGIPMFLVCEDLVGAATPEPSRPAVKADLLNSFRQHASLLPIIHPDAKADDLAKLIEVLAERDFGMNLGKGSR